MVQSRGLPSSDNNNNPFFNSFFFFFFLPLLNSSLYFELFMVEVFI